MSVYTDQIGRQVTIPASPQRIVSLVPSITELLYGLELDNRVVGITKFCVHPPQWFQNKTRIGGTKNIKPDVIHSLQPDLIIANKEENIQAQVEALAQHYPVWVSDVNTLPQALDMIQQIGNITSKAYTAFGFVTSITEVFDELAATINADGRPHMRAAYIIWRDPYMTIGHDTFIHDLLTRCGLQNVFENTTRYPAITIEQLQQSGCQLLLLSSEPYPFKQQHIDELQPLLPDTKIVLVDGEFFSWYGSRLLYAPDYFMELLHLLNS